jgi:GTP cyclohydrolase II
MYRYNNDKINDNETKKENKFFASLNDILKNKNVEKYVSLTSQAPPKEQGLAGGGVYNIDDNGKQIEQIESNTKYSSITGKS